MDRPVEGVPLPRPAISFLQAGRTIKTATIQRDGTFLLTLPQGDYTVTVSSVPNDYVLRSLRHGSVDVRTNLLKLTGVLQELQVDIGLNVPATFVRVSGQVSGSDRLPAFGFNSVFLERGPDVQPLRASIRMDGRFEFPRVRPGSYTARVVDASESALAEVLPVAVRVVAGSDVSGVAMAVQQLVPVTGRIRVEGQAAPPYVSLFFADATGRSFSSDIGNDDGVLKAQLVPGEYRVRVLSLSSGYTVTGVTKDSVDVLAGTLKAEQDMPLELAINVRSSAKAVGVRGRVVRTSNTDPPPGRITLYVPIAQVRATGVLSPRALTTVVRPDGSFEFTNVVPGFYLLDVEFDNATRGDYLTNMLHEPQSLVVGDAGATGIEVRVPRHVQMTVRFVVEGGGPMPRPAMETEFVTTAPSLRHRLAGLIPNSDGTSRLTLPEGAYRFTVRELPPGYSVRSMLQSGRNVLNQPFLLSPDSRELVVVLGSTAPLRKVRGRVLDAPNPGSTSSISVKLWMGVTEIETTVGPGGRFEFSKVPPGTYTVGVDSASGSMSPAQVAIGDGPSGEPRITVADRDIEDLRVTSNTGITAFVGRGRAVVEGGGPMPRFGLTFSGGGGSIDPSRVDGTFQTWMRVGSSKVAVSHIPKEYVLKALTYGETNLLERELELRATDVNSDLLRIVLAPSGIP